MLWVVDAEGGAREVESDTPFNVVDVLRSATLLYRCRQCGEYGPLRCLKCEDGHLPARLCARCAHTIKDELSAYCPDHVPRCSCREDCGRSAVFRCRRCRKLFGEHVRRQNPHDPDVDYCQRCYQHLFEQCGVCVGQGQPRLGQSKCAFKLRDAESPCATPLCWGHSFQWKIWGPHNRGVTLCERHKLLLPTTEPADLLYLMLTARPPFVQRGRRQSLPNPFRLRRIVNRNRPAPLTFDQIGSALRSTSSQVERWGESAKRSHEYMSRTFDETVRGLANVEVDWQQKVKAFYQRVVSRQAAEAIAGVEIADCFFKPGQPPRYRLQLRLNTANTLPYIGHRGATINQLCSELNVDVDVIRERER